MSSEVIKGFSIALDLDTLQVEQGMKDLNRTMSRVNSEFSRSLSSFDRGERSMARYDTTLRGLNSKLEVQEQVVDRNRRNYDGLSKEYNNNRDALNRTDQALKDANDSYLTAERRLEELSQANSTANEEWYEAAFAMQDAKDELERTEQAYTELNEQVNQNRVELDNAEIALNNAERQYNNLERSIERNMQAMKELHIEQSIADSQWTKSGDAMINFSDKLGNISGVATRVGDDLTRKVTMPALGVAAAAGGIVAAFGWGRLVSLDSAQAQLRGLGYDAEEVESITANLVDALDGGMMTLAEATSAAATAMAAGVEQGDELTRYIQILDAAVVGGTGTFQEMEQVFGRIVDQGHLTRNEFDIIANRMPGFSSAVQKHFGIGSEAMYQMLRDGEITSEEFLDIMENFAGDMATEFAKSWSGMVQNLKAYIGIIGENLLEGVFQQSKEEIAGFIDMLSSDEAIEWAEEWGHKVGTAFRDTVDGIKDVVNWYTDLEDWQQKLIISAGIFAVSIGPVLSIVGRLGTGVSVLVGGFGKLFKAIGVKSGTAKALSTFGGIASSTGAKVGTAAAGTGLAGKVGLLGGTLSAFGGPAGIAAFALGTTLVGGLVVAYNESEVFRDIVNELATLIGEGLVQSIETAGEFLSWLGESTLETVDLLVGELETADGEMITFTESVERGWERVSGALGDGYNFLVETFTGFHEEYLKGQESIEGFSDVVSEETQSMIEDYTVFSEEAHATLQEMYNQQGELTDEQIEDLKTAYDTMHEEAIARLEERRTAELAETEERLKGLKTLDDKDKEGILTRQEEHFNTEEQMLGDKHQRILEAIENNIDDNGRLTEGGYKAIQKIQEDHNIATAENLSASEIEQQAIMERIKNNTTAISQEMTSDLIKDSAEARKQAVEEAEKKRDETIAWAIDQYENHGTISEDEKDEIIRSANLQYDETTRLAESRHDEVLDWASEQAKEHGIIVDGETGDILSKWDVFKNSLTGSGGILAAIATGVWDSAQTIAGNLANPVIRGMNKLNEGFNSIVGGLGLPDSWKLDVIPEFNQGSERKVNVGPSSQSRGAHGGNQAISNYSTGTNYHMGGTALLGDVGPGNSPGVGGSRTREIVELPNSKRYLVDGDVIWPDFPVGAKVKNNKETEAILANEYAADNLDEHDLGSGALSGFLTRQVGAATARAVNVGMSFQSMLDNIHEFMDDPGVLVNKMLGGINFDGISSAVAIGHGVVDKLTSGMIDRVKEMFAQTSSTGDGSYVLNRPITAHFGRYPPGINFNNGIHYGLDTHHVFDQLRSPINGVVDKVWNDYGGGLSMQIKSGRDYWWFMHLSSALKAAGKSVKAGDVIARTGNSGNWTTGAHLHTQYMPNVSGFPGNHNAKDPLPVLKNLGSFENGGLISRHGFYEGGEGNKPEMVIPLTNRSRAIELMLQVMSMIGDSGGGQAPNINVKGIIDKLEKQIELLQVNLENQSAMIEILLKINMKELNITPNDIGPLIDEYNGRQHSKSAVKTGRMRYGNG